MFLSMNKAVFTLSSLLLSSFSAHLFAGETPPKLRLAEVEQMAPTGYRAALTVDPAEDTFTGSIAISLEVQQPTSVIWLNGNKLSIDNASLKTLGNQMQATVLPGGSDFIGLKFSSPVPAGPSILDIGYSGVVHKGSSAGLFSMEDAGNHYLYTQFESTDARDVFPCFDEPSYKVPWQLTLHVPAKVNAVSNTPVVSESKEEPHTFVFKQTKPLPSYLIAFAVGPFDFVDAGTAGRNHFPVRIVTPRGKAGEAKYASEVTATILTRLEDYFGIPYPYEKSDQMAIPVTFGFGAMENAGMVTYAQTLLLARPDTDTIARQRGYASVAAHELAHQWFGDLVTTAWWNDIWLNEAFATWTSAKILAEWHPEWNTRVNNVGAKLGAENQDSLVSARKIRQPIESKDDISNAFDGITYQKGAAVIGMFESWIGQAEFRKGIQSYLKQYAFKNATAGDFLDAVSSGSGRNVTAAFSTFLNQAGVPLVSMALDCKQGAPTLHLTQKRALPLGSKGSSDEVWQIPVCVRYGTGTAGQSECSLMMQPSADWKLKASSCPAWVEGNSDAVGYYRVNYQPELLDALASGEVDKRMNAPERVDFMGNAEALSSEGDLPAGDALKFVAVFHADPERQVLESSLRLALSVREHLVPAELMPNYQRFLRKNFQAKAHELGWTSKPGEPDEVHLLRPELLRAVATVGGDQELANQAKELTAKWFENHAAISPEMTGAVLGTAAYYGDEKLFEQFVAAYKDTKDRQERQRIMGAMTSFRDPGAIQAGYKVVLSGQIPMIQSAQLLFAGQGQEATRHLAFDFTKAHFDELAAKRPQGGGFDFGSRFPAVGQSYCDAESRSALEDFFAPKVTQFTGGPRALAQTLERVDLCIAERKAQEPSVAAFLATQ
jgi:alanyl aminopeptidase